MADAPTAADGGFVTATTVVAVALSLVLVSALANLLVFTYGRGVVRAALDEGVRAGATAVASPASCDAAARAVLSDLLGGSMGDGVLLRCVSSAAGLTAIADVRFVGWSPLVPDWVFRIEATAVQERSP